MAIQALRRMPLVCAAAAILGLAGCDDGGENLTGAEFGVDPVDTSLGPSKMTLALTAVTGESPIAWKVSDSTLGSVTPTEGRTVTYRQTGKAGINTIVVKDARGRQTQAVIRQSVDATVKDLAVSPASATLARNGDKQTFTASGSTGKYHWSVGDPTRGRLEIYDWHQAVYTRLQAGSTDVILNDEHGHAVVAAVNQSDAGTQMTATANPSSLGNNGERSVLTAGGGRPPYLWEVQNTALGHLQTATGNSVVYVRDAPGQNVVSVVDSAAAAANVAIAQPDNGGALKITATPASLARNGDLSVLSVAGGVGPFNWTVLDPALGHVLTATGTSVVYVRDAAGVSVVSVQDSTGVIANALVAQP
jgi:hypothetical protein